MTALLSGLVLGLAGSGHCAGMCGPLVLTVGRGLAAPSRRAQLQHALLYHSGRLLTYAALAVPVGLAGQALAVRGLGRPLAILAAALLLLAAFGSIRATVASRLGGVWAAGIARASGRAARWGRAHPVSGAVLTGAANGLLPCGLVYAAVAAGAAAGSAGDAVALMVGFGLGTTPVLVAMSVSALSVPPALRLRLRRLTPVALALVAALLLLRAFMLPHGASHAVPETLGPAAAAHH
jgi:uncharacterized protein